MRERTDRPFAIGFITPFLEFTEPLLPGRARRPARRRSPSRSPIPATGPAGSRTPGCRLICQVQTFADAELAVDAGADVLVAQGTEAGGHTGTMSLLPLLAGHRRGPSRRRAPRRRRDRQRPHAGRRARSPAPTAPGSAPPSSPPRGRRDRRRPQGRDRGQRRRRHRLHPRLRHRLRPAVAGRRSASASAATRSPTSGPGARPSCAARAERRRAGRRGALRPVGPLRRRRRPRRRGRTPDQRRGRADPALAAGDAPGLTPPPARWPNVSREFDRRSTERGVAVFPAHLGSARARVRRAGRPTGVVMRDVDEPVANPLTNETFAEVLDDAPVAAEPPRRWRGHRGRGGVALGGVGSLLDALPAAATQRPRRSPARLLGFQGIPVSTADTVVVPPGYTARVLIAWGDPVSNGPAFKQDASNTAADQAQQWGMHNDGVVYFPIDGSRARPARPEQRVHRRRPAVPRRHRRTGTRRRRQVAERPRRRRSSRSRKQPQRGRRGDGRAGRPRVRPPHHRADADRRSAARPPATRACRRPRDPTGRRVLGTLNNCAMGYTPWGTYLACEENFNGYFRKTAPPTAPIERRYGITAVGAGYLLAHDRRALRRRHRAERAEPLRLGRRDRPVRPDARRRSSAPRSGASSTRAPGCRRPGTAASSSTWATTSSSSTSTATSRAGRGAGHAPRGHQPARRRHAVRRQVPRRRHRRVAAADARQPGARPAGR